MKNLTDLLSSISRRRLERSVTFVELARKLAAGEQVAIDVAERTLTETGKSEADLAAAVELMEKRLKWHAEANQLVQIDRVIAETKEKLAAANAKIAQAAEEHRRVAIPLHESLQLLYRKHRDADAAGRHLISTCPDPALRAELADVEKQLEAARQRVTKLNEERQKIDIARSNFAEAERHGDSERGRMWRKHGERHQAAGSAAAAELPQAEAEVQRLEEAEKNVYERMLAP